MIGFRPRRRRGRRFLALLLIVGTLVGAGYVLIQILGDDPTGAAPTPSTTDSSSSTTTSSTTTTTLPTVTTADAWPMFQATPDRAGRVSGRATISDPAIAWQSPVGNQGWLNNPVICGNRVFVGSAGRLWSNPDEGDGVYAIDLRSGDQIWFTQEVADVNGVACASDRVVATTDAGAATALMADTGEAIWRYESDALMFTNPLVAGDLVVVGNHRGQVFALDLGSGELRWSAQVAGPIRGGVASDDERIYVAGEAGEAAAFTYEGEQVWRTTLELDDSSIAVRVFGAPSVASGRVIIPFIRDRGYPEPALLALDPITGAKLWEAPSSDAKASWGNIRSSPAVAGETLLFGDPVSEGLYAASIEDGSVLWAAEYGPTCVPHWPSPAVVDDQVLFARNDGAVYGVSLNSHELIWSIYLGHPGQAGGDVPDDTGAACAAASAADPGWPGNTIFASPAIAKDGTVIIGSARGRLYAIRDRGWDE